MANALIRVSAENTADANLAAGSLRRSLLHTGGTQVSVELLKEAADTQDFGQALSLIFAAPAVSTIARGIADWLRRLRIGSSVRLEINGTSLELTGEIADHPERVESLVKALVARE